MATMQSRSLQTSPVQQHRQVKAIGTQMSSGTVSPVLATQQLGVGETPVNHKFSGAVTDDVAPRMGRPQEQQIARSGFTGGSMPAATAPARLQEPQTSWRNIPMSMSVPFAHPQPFYPGAHSVKVPVGHVRHPHIRQQTRSLEPVHRSRTAVRCIMPVRSRSGTPRREYMPVVYQNPSPNIATARSPMGTPVQYFTTAGRKVGSPGSASTSMLISQVSTPARAQTRVAAPQPQQPNVVAPSSQSQSFQPPKESSSPPSLCSTLQRVEVAAAKAPVVYQPPASYTAPAPTTHRQQSTDLASTTQMTPELVQAVLDNKNLKQEIQELRQKEELTRVSLEESKADNTDLTTVNNTLRSQLEKKESEFTSKQREIMELQCQNEALAKEAQMQAERCQQNQDAARNLEGRLRSQECSYQKRLEAKEKENNELTEKMKTIRFDKATFQSECDAMRLQRDDWCHRYEKMKVENQGLRKKLDVVQEELVVARQRAATGQRVTPAPGDVVRAMQERSMRNTTAENYELKEKVNELQQQVEMLSR
eukprot:gb/GFBE01015108.1/.p1 GENE.gb/GFBE01015108.1/~~gb/GFBE01015108.1/.p1  ORF type:complete len:535 (+),score=99.82 gb/GFBE01015108.1/:1-1605(+)